MGVGGREGGGSSATIVSRVKLKLTACRSCNINGQDHIIGAYSNRTTESCPEPSRLVFPRVGMSSRAIS